MPLRTKDLKWLQWAAQGAPLFSTCAKNQYLALIVGADGHLLGTGYNGGPKGTPHCDEGYCPRAVNNVPSGTPYDKGDGFCIAIHAEQNALLHTDWTQRAGATLYVNGTPCVDCARLLSNSGISRVMYLVDERLGDDAIQWFWQAGNIEAIPVTTEQLAVASNGD